MGAGSARCPRTGTVGVPVPPVTLESLLQAEAQGRRVAEEAHFFCAEPSCPIVYFTRQGATFSTQDLVVPVWQKRPDDAETPVCYCFGHSLSTMAEELAQTGRCTAQLDIASKVKAGLCDCERRNPQGRCCLGNVAIALRRLKGEG